MTPWSDRPFEVAHLVNPAFTGLLLREFASNYARASKNTPELLLAFLALPLVVHRPTRRRLPSSTITKHHVWLEENPDLRVGFVARCQAASPHVRESIVFSVACGWIELIPTASFQAKKRSLKSGWRSLGENSDHLKAAGFVGRWFAGAGSTASLYAHWGVTP